MENIITYSGLIAAGLAVMVLLFVTVQSYRFKKLRSLFDLEKQANNKHFERIQRQYKQQEEFLNELKMATRGISDKILALQNQDLPEPAALDEVLSIQEQTLELKEQMIELNSRLQAMESADPASKLYTKASKLIASGATIEDIMQECDLPRAEAELMMSLHSGG